MRLTEGSLTALWLRLLAEGLDCGLDCGLGLTGLYSSSSGRGPDADLLACCGLLAAAVMRARSAAVGSEESVA